MKPHKCRHYFSGENRYNNTLFHADKTKIRVKKEISSHHKIITDETGPMNSHCRGGSVSIRINNTYSVLIDVEWFVKNVTRNSLLIQI